MKGLTFLCLKENENKKKPSMLRPQANWGHHRVAEGGTRRLCVGQCELVRTVDQALIWMIYAKWQLLKFPVDLNQGLVLRG